METSNRLSFKNVSLLNLTKKLRLFYGNSRKFFPTQSSFLRYIIYLTPNLKNFSRMSTLRWHTFFIKWSITSKVIQGHIRTLLYQNHSSIFVYGLMLILKTQFFYFKTLTYVLMDNFCPFLMGTCVIHWSN